MMFRRKQVLIIWSVLVTMLFLVACSTPEESTEEQVQEDAEVPAESEPESEEAASEEVVEEESDTGSTEETTETDPAAALAAIAESGQVFSTGPNGESPTAASEISLTEEELEEIRAMEATAAIVLHFGGNDWSNAQIDGLTQQFEEMGIEIVSVTDAGSRPEKQVSDIETVLALDPDIIVSIPTDPVATAEAYQAAAEAGVTLVFMDNVPTGMTAGEDYVSVVSADNYGNGVVSAHLLAEELGGEGQIGTIYFTGDFFVTTQRWEAFVETIENEYPNIEIVEQQGIGGPDWAGDAETAASAMLTAYPDLDGIWTVFDIPAEGTLGAARAVGRDDLNIATIDLGLNVAIDLARDGMVCCIGSQRPLEQGITEAMLAGYGLLGKEAPEYVALPALAVDNTNVLEAWEIVYQQEPPEELLQAAE